MTELPSGPQEVLARTSRRHREAVQARDYLEIPSWYRQIPATPYVPGWTCLYGIKCGDFLKIGITRTLGRRFEDIQKCNPNKCRIAIEHRVATSGAIFAERFLHETFAKQRLHGEWFAIKPADVRPHLKEAAKRAAIVAEIRMRVTERYPAYDENDPDRPRPTIQEIVNMPRQL